MENLLAMQVVKELEFTPEPGFALLDRSVNQFGSRSAIDFMGRKWTYKQLGNLVGQAAAGLQKLGVSKGVNVGLCMPNCPYFVIMYHAILKTGGTVVNFNPLYTEREIEMHARDGDVSIMVTLDLAMIQKTIVGLVIAGKFRQVVVCSMAAALPWRKSVLFRLFKAKELASLPEDEAFIRFEDLIAGQHKLVQVAIDPLVDVAVLQFTGGTTGTPKAAILTHANITVIVRQARMVLSSLKQGEERFMAALPFFHVFGMTSVMNVGIDAAAELVMLPRPEIKTLMDTINRTKPTIFSGVPTLFTSICAAIEEADMKKEYGKSALDSVKYFISGGAPIAAEVLDRFERISHNEILEGYGLSETASIVSFNVTGAVKRGSVGKALPGTIIEIRDIDDPSKILSRGERGEICVRGPQVMRGYYRQPEETAEVFVDGALRTGDVGILDEDGYLTIVDRIKDLIICSGYNIYPRVIEEAAYQHQAVQDAIAIGVPDEYRGQAPKLYVSLRPGMMATEPELKEFLSVLLNKLEIPRAIEIRASLPKTMVGKLSKKDLIAEMAAQRESPL